MQRRVYVLLVTAMNGGADSIRLMNPFTQIETRNVAEWTIV